MNNSPNQNHLNCQDECVHCIDIIACGFSIQPSYLEYILPNLHLLTLIAFLQLFSGGFFWRQLRFGGNWLGILASCFSKIKKPNKYCLGNQTKFSIFLRNNRDCMVVDPYKEFSDSTRKFVLN